MAVAETPALDIHPTHHCAAGETAHLKAADSPAHLHATHANNNATVHSATSGEVSVICRFRGASAGLDGSFCRSPTGAR